MGQSEKLQSSFKKGKPNVINIRSDAESVSACQCLSVNKMTHHTAAEYQDDHHQAVGN
jgi:hypothetical protein